MCTNYAAARRDRIFKQFGVEPPDSFRMRKVVWRRRGTTGTSSWRCWHMS